MLIGVGLLIVGTAGCQTGDPPRDGEVSDGVVFTGDIDGDGACDATEVGRGLDPRDPDTDNDGIPDGVELLFGFDALGIDSPDPETVTVIFESPESTAQQSVARQLTGMGDTVAGAFTGLPAGDALGLDAFDFVTDSVAFSADPRSNVFDIDSAAERFLGVEGRTQLVFEVSFSFGGQTPRSCARVYPWIYTMRRVETGVDAYTGRFTLIVVPEGERFGVDATWCSFQGVCI